MPHSFKGSDTKPVTLEAEGIGFIARALENFTLKGQVADVGASLDAWIATDPEPGVHDLSHDQISVLYRLLCESLFAKGERQAARVVLDELQRVFNSFYQEGA